MGDHRGKAPKSARSSITINTVPSMFPLSLSYICVLSPDAELPQMIKQPVEVRKPQNQNNDDHAIQDRFDLSLHWDEPVHEPQQEPHGDNCDDDGGKWHFTFSNLNIGPDTR
jgi:hypothetical protein